MSVDAAHNHSLWAPLRALLFVVCLALLPAGLAAEPAALEQRLAGLTTAPMPTVGEAPVAAPELIQRFYAARGHRPAWTRPELVVALLDAIDASRDDGLAPADFHRNAVAQLAEEVDRGDPVGREILLTDALVRLLYQLAYGKVEPRRLDPAWNLDRPDLPGNLLEAAGEALDEGNIEGVVERVRLDHPTYRGLRRGLARYRAIAAAGGWPVVPDGPVLERGALDPRVAMLRERLMATGDLTEPPSADPDRLDGPMEEAVRRFQARHGLAVDGRVGPATRAALNVPVEWRIAQLRANLERARWVLRLDPPDVIDVDIAGFSVERRERGTVTWRSRAIVGQPYRQTPVFVDQIRYIDFNPTWTVPRSIFIEDIVPKIRENPAYLREQGFDVRDRDGAQVSLTVATAAVLNDHPFPWTLVQRPGPLNALGRVKFMFPNDYAVYLHDTPSRELFGQASRLFSSGCIRVEDATGLATLLLAANPGWDRARIEEVMASGESTRVFLQRRMPVRLLYRTADVAADGAIQFRSDIYDRDPPLLRALDQPFRPVLPSWFEQAAERAAAG